MYLDSHAASSILDSLLLFGVLWLVVLRQLLRTRHLSAGAAPEHHDRIAHVADVELPISNDDDARGSSRLA